MFAIFKTYYNSFLFIIGGISALVLFLCINVISNAIFSNSRVDLTEEGLYTLSNNTLNVLDNLKEPVKLRLFFSEKLSRDLPPLREYGQRIREILESYESRSNNKITLSRVDPQPFTDTEDLAVVYGLQGVPISAARERFYFGLVATNSVDDTIVIPFFNQEREEFLEYDLTRIIDTLSNPRKTKIGLVSSLPINGGLPRQDANPSEYIKPWVVHQRIIELFEVKDLGDNFSSIDEDIDILLVVHPKELNEKSLYAIDQFVLSGKGSIFFVDPFSETERGFVPGPERAMNIPSSTSTMNSVFESWGFNIEPGMIVGDETNGRKVSLGRGPDSRVTTYLFWHALNKSNISINDVTTNQLSQIFFKTVGSINNINIKQDFFEPLMISSKESMLYERFRIQYRVDPEELLSTFNSENKTNVLAARISGIFPSAFPDYEIKELEENNNTANQPSHLIQSTNTSNIIVVADSDFLADDTWVSQQDNFGRNAVTPLSDNGTFVINALESLSGGNDLISLRSRGVSNRPFEVVRKLEIIAESKFRETERSLQNELAMTEKNYLTYKVILK